MFSIRETYRFDISKPHNSCNLSKVINTGTSPKVYMNMNNGIVYGNTEVNSVPNLSCIINSTKTKLTNQPYNPLINPLLI